MLPTEPRLRMRGMEWVVSCFFCLFLFVSLFVCVCLLFLLFYFLLFLYRRRLLKKIPHRLYTIGCTFISFIYNNRYLQRFISSYFILEIISNSFKNPLVFVVIIIKSKFFLPDQSRGFASWFQTKNKTIVWVSIMQFCKIWRENKGMVKLCRNGKFLLGFFAFLDEILPCSLCKSMYYHVPNLL